MTVTISSRLRTGSAQFSVIGPSLADTGETVAGTEDAIVEIHVMSYDKTADGATYFRLRAYIEGGVIGGTVEKSVVFIPIDSPLDAVIIMTGSKVQLSLTGLTTALDWVWWSIVDIK